MSALSDPATRLADRWQRGFPLVPRPFADIAAAEGLTEGEAIEMLEAVASAGRLSRIGATVRPNAVGASTLAAMAVPRERLETVAAMVSAEPYVNHNYEREHPINLWFVVVAPDRAALESTLAAIEARTGIEVLDLRLERPYHIDLGFRLGEGGAGTPRRCAPVPGYCPDARDRVLLGAIEDGLPLTRRPYAEIGETVGMTEDDVIAGLARLRDADVISRFGCILRHRALGYRANAMVVWDVPDDRADDLGARLAVQQGVTLCYRRTRRPPAWPYNLFCMVHGVERGTVTATVEAAARSAGLDPFPSATLFSTRCFKQRGARFSPHRQGRAA